MNAALPLLLLRTMVSQGGPSGSLASPELTSPPPFLSWSARSRSLFRVAAAVQIAAVTGKSVADIYNGVDTGQYTSERQAAERRAHEARGVELDLVLTRLDRRLVRSSQPCYPLRRKGVWWTQD